MNINFSSSTSPNTILNIIEQSCEYKKNINGTILTPRNASKWIVVFCDEINLPSLDTYGTQSAISFLRQLIEKAGFWCPARKLFVRIDRIQFVGACNPPTDPGRFPLSERFLRYTPVIYVDYPSTISLSQIYSTYMKGITKLLPTIRGYSEDITNAMIKVYELSKESFTSDQQVHYIYSPRELTRWIRGIYENIKNVDDCDFEYLVKIWAHEALRLFQDRLTSSLENLEMDKIINETASNCFPNINLDLCLQRPIIIANWISKSNTITLPVAKDFINARLRVFYEEELDKEIYLHDEALEHILRIDRVLKQPQGHLLLIGVSGIGRTTLTKFVSWMNGITFIQLHTFNGYTSQNFDDELKSILRRCASKSERICLLIDESNVLDSGFLEKMNTLLANSEIPGLFVDEELNTLMSQCKESAFKLGKDLKTNDEIYSYFTSQIMSNLHIIFTMNPPKTNSSLSATKSPALFNRCVIDWFGDLTEDSLYQISAEMTKNLDLNVVQLQNESDLRSLFNSATVRIHAIVVKLLEKYPLVPRITPRHFLNFISQFNRLFNEKKESFEEDERHINIGLDKINETVIKVEEYKSISNSKRIVLKAKSSEANEKLVIMMKNQSDAEISRQQSLIIQKEIAEQNIIITDRRGVVMQDLSLAEPAVREAQESVKGINKSQLTEVRSMSNPPEAVKLTMEAISILLGHKVDTWKTVQSIIRKDDFIASIVSYDTDKLSQGMRKKIRNDYMSHASFNFEVVNRASKACGPLVQWVISQITYGDILERIGPLRDEVIELEKDAAAKKLKGDSIESELIELEERIEQYKCDYAALISDVQSLKSELEIVETRANRSSALLGILIIRISYS